MQDRCPLADAACVYIYEIGLVQLRVLRRRSRADRPAVLSLGNKVDVSVSGIPARAGRRAVRPAARRPERARPRARVKKKVRIRLNGVSVSAAIKALGLTTQKAPRPSPAAASRSAPAASRAATRVRGARARQHARPDASAMRRPRSDALTWSRRGAMRTGDPACVAGTSGIHVIGS